MMDIAFNIFNERNAILTSSSIIRSKEEQDMFGRMIEIIKTPDSINVSGPTKQVLLDISSLNVFQDEDMNQLLKIVLERSDSQSSQVGLLDNLLHMFFSREKAKTMTAAKILENNMFKQIWMLTTGDDLSRSELLHNFGTNIHNWRTRNIEIKRKQLVPCLDNQRILKRMKKVCKFHSQAPSSGLSNPWFTSKHHENLKSLVVFNDKTMDDILKRVIVLPSSQNSILGVFTNLLRIFWKRKDCFHLTPKQVLQDNRFLKIFTFVINGSIAGVDPKIRDFDPRIRYQLENSLKFIRKYYD